MNPQELLRAFPLEPSLYGTAIIMGVLLLYARGLLSWFGNGWTFSAALVLGIGGAMLTALKGEEPREVAHDGLALAGVTLLLQYPLRQMAKRVRFMPEENEWSGRRRGRKRKRYARRTR